MVDKPKIHVATEQRRAKKEVERQIPEGFVNIVFATIFQLHSDVMITYTMSEEAQQLFDELLDKHVAEFSSQYQIGSIEHIIYNQ